MLHKGDIIRFIGNEKASELSNTASWDELHSISENDIGIVLKQLSGTNMYDCRFFVGDYLGHHNMAMYEFECELL